ncbi:hypothetical protein [Amycolatopsis sp. WQ 127309]|uniref:hypothetical protein n=1 Tax=Amycolatopsis sp. WQ 127309 TaxID=2932773 RepID=UPI001FF2352E|nr:hypothetical protein [Amycolatopsis sp. WQ 127309]UOZ06939.1 hypothetical protein MUY22_01190 [Amycolatopsis sp. WQ 127309]
MAKFDVDYEFVLTPERFWSSWFDRAAGQRLREEVRGGDRATPESAEKTANSGFRLVREIRGPAE